MERSLISALCMHSFNNVTGFMMVVQTELNIGQLLVNETGPGAPMGPITIQVEENQNYHVAIFPKNADSGVVHSVLAYSLDVFVKANVLIDPTGLISRNWQSVLMHGCILYTDYTSQPVPTESTTTITSMLLLGQVVIVTLPWLGRAAIKFTANF